MIVEYYGRSKQAYGNICFPKSWPMRAGKYPAAHPCSGNPEPTVFSRESQPESDDPLGRFRALGYLASCFPEGDGISFDPPSGKSTADVVTDIKSCFGWEVVVKRP